ncbi:peptidoglycan-binding domain-containing protein [Leisingera caerulea]|uniref:peptidoglycan-binding domain-containing protein n=1 Tax=Leisingera caerulea TaxID=506591 RepID=UPI000487223A|nr:peptidoglycan-binding domain-containing protein [Leisingera caerulea]
MRDLQESLNALGFDAGPADGIFGLRTSRALNAYRSVKGAPFSGYPLAKEAEAIISAAREADGSQPIAVAATAAVVPPDTPGVAPVPTRVFAGPGQFPPSRFRGYGFLAFPALASEYDFDRHMKLCQAYVNSLPATSSVKQPRGDQFVTVWPIKDKRLASSLNGKFLRLETSAKCSKAIDDYDDGQAREVLANVRAAQNVSLDGRGPYLFGWIPANEYGQAGKLILMLDLSRVTTYEQALVQLQSWQQKIATNPELLRDGLSVENIRRTIRDWSDQHGQAFLMLIGAG